MSDVDTILEERRQGALWLHELGQTQRLDLGEAVGRAEAANEALSDLGGEVASHVVRCKLASVAQRLAVFPSVPQTG